MKKHLLIFFSFLLFLFGGNILFGQTVVTIGAGITTTERVPMNRAWDYSTWEAIYLQTEIATAGNITNIEFYKDNTDDGSSIGPVTVYMMHTAATGLATGAFSTTGYTTVLSGTITNAAAPGWKMITLSTPFAYNNTSNLQIAIDRGFQAFTTSYPLWRVTAQATTMNRRCFQDVTPCSASLTAVTGRPNIRLTISAGLSYCTPTYSLGCADVVYDFINRVRIGTLDNTPAGTSVGTTCATRYADYYSSVAAPNLAQGTAYNLLVTVGNDVGNYTAAWFDFNQDGDFLDAGEYFNGGNPGALGTATIAITVPAGATLGNTRMRVRGGEDNSINLQSYACGASPSGYGEAEDYKVNIISGCAVTVTTHPVSTCASVGAAKTFSVVATGTGGATPYQWQISTDNGATFSNLSNGGNYSGVTTATLTVSGVPGGFNGYQYRCACSNACTTYSNAAVISVGSAPSAPTANAATGVSSTGFTANWTAVAGATKYYLDVATANTFTLSTFVPGYENLDVGNVTSKAITGLACGTTYYYRVMAYSGCGTSVSSNIITRATTTCTNDNCSGAIAIAVSGTCSSPWYSTALATVSTETTTCTSGYQDVWFSFVAPATGTVTIDVMGSRKFDPQFDLLSGTCAGGFTCLATLDKGTIAQTESMYATGLTPGTTYYVKVNNWGGGGSYDGGYGAFAICITSGTTAGLVNDAASGAVALTNYDCYPQDTRGWVFYTTVGATNASEPALPACWTSTLTANKTIWFKFTATTTQQLVTTNWWCSQVARGAPDNRMAVYSSSNNLSTGAFTLIGCLEDIRNTTSTPSSSLYGFENPSFAGFWTHEDLQTALTVTGLTIGNTYFIRIDAADGIVSVCTEPNTILNDDCATALNAPLNTVMRVNTTGLGPWSNISIPDLGFSCGTVQNMMYYYFDPAFTDLYYINQWSQLCDMSVGSQFIVCNAGLNCATLQQATVGNNTGNIMICSNTTTGNRALSANFTAGQRYYIIWDGGSGDECDFYWQITRSIPAPLPVTLLDFYVGCEKSSVKAVWTTATETNNDYFILERSSDGINFTEGDKVKGAGTTSTPHTYSTYDNEIGKTMYYRIKQVDFNGEFTYSKTASVNCKASRLDVTAIVPVPSDNYIDIYYTLEKDDNMQFMVYDLLGNQVILESARGIKGGNLQRISLINLSGGMYHITVSSSTESFSDKIIKQ